MLADLARVAAYSASASFGRDMYKSLKRANIFVLLLAGMFLTVLGFRHLVKGHDRGIFGTVFITVIGSIVMIILGLVFAAPAIYYLGISFAPGTANSEASTAQAKSILIVGSLYFLCAAAAGLTWGFVNRSARNRVMAIEQHNLEFLEREGFRDLGVGEDIIEDSDGNCLKYKGEEEHLIVFTIVGRRNVRAAINLDQDGRMISYSGPVKLG
jgi:hypothetical protein